MLDTPSSVDALRLSAGLAFAWSLTIAWEAGLALVELSVMEQRYRAVLEAEAGCPVTEVAARHGVSRQSVHAWVRRYRSGGLAALADRSHRPGSCPHQVPAEIEALTCELRRAHPRWGPTRLVFELSKRDIIPVPSEATLYRVLVRNGLIAPGQHRRPASSYVRWEREQPMDLWQLDIMGGVFLADGTGLKLVSGVDDHSRYCVIAQLVRRATGRAVCTAFAASLARFGVPAEVLSDNGKQFTGRFTRPRPSEVLFERICRENGITTRLTRPRTPTTTGKIERWHKTLRQEFLAGQDSFATLAHAQAQLDTWVTNYNDERPHQSLGMATPASRFTTRAAPVVGQGQELPLRLPPSLVTLPAAPSPAPPPLADSSAQGGVAVEIDRIVPASGNMFAAGRQVWLGKALAGQQVTLRLDHTSLHVFHAGQLLKTCPVTLGDKDLARLRATGGRPARPSPATALPPGPLAADAVVEVQRLVGSGGCVGIGGKQISAGIHLAGQRITLRIDAKLIHVITAGGVLARTLPSPLPPAARGRLHGARLAGPAPAPVAQALHVTRVVSSQGGLMVAGVKIHLGHVHRGKVVTVIIEDSQFRILHDGTQLAACPRTVIKEVTRRSASGHPGYQA
jgi:transposase InsO family protein